MKEKHTGWLAMLLAVTTMVACGSPPATTQSSATQEGTPPAATQSSATQEAAPPMTPEQRLEDLDYLCTQLEKKHKNLYAKVSKEDFAAQQQDIAARVGEMTDQQFFFELKQLLALLRDAHTDIAPKSPMDALLIFGIGSFDNQWRLTVVDAQQKQHLGSTVVAIGDTPIDEAFQKARSILSYGNEAWAQAQFANLVSSGDALAYLGILPSAASATISVRKNDTAAVEQFTLQAIGQAQLTKEMVARLTPASQPATAAQGIYRSMELSDDTYFIQYNSCQQAPDLPMKEFVKTVSDELERGGYKKAIVDLRYNGGGNSAIFEPMIAMLKNLRDEKGVTTYTLIGSNTFSSALMNAVQLQQRAQSVLVGAPTGGDVNHYGELKELKLPNSGHSVWYSTKYFQQIPGYEKDSLYPDIAVSTALEDYLQGVDPEVQTILAL